MKLSLNEAKLSGLWARNCVTFNWLWFQNLPSDPKSRETGPRTVTGTFSRNRPLTRSCNVNRKKIIAGFSVHTILDSYRIKKCPLWRPGSKSCGFVSRIHQIRVDNSRIHKEKSWIQKYPDTCGRGLRRPRTNRLCSFLLPFGITMGYTRNARKWTLEIIKSGLPQLGLAANGNTAS